MNDSLLALLRRIDTPTVCNAVETAQGKRGFSAFTRGTVLSSHPGAPAFAGYARTAKIRALSPPDNPPEAAARRMDYYRYMSEGPRPAVAVLEDTDFPGCAGAYWGEVNTTVHKGFGISGALTNGVMRDLDALPEGFPVIAGSVGPSHMFVHVTEIDCPVTVFGMAVSPGDLIHADRHGALVIPPEVISALEGAVKKMTETERLVLDSAGEDGFDFEKFEKVWAAFEAARA